VKAADIVRIFFFVKQAYIHFPFSPVGVNVVKNNIINLIAIDISNKWLREGGQV